MHLSTRRRRPLPPLLGLGLGLVLTAACSPHLYTDTQAVVVGDPERGRQLIGEYGCASCHQVPGVQQPMGRVGPPLGDFAARRVVAGLLPNVPENARAWIQDPQEIDPQSIMPDLGVTDADALDITAYLYSLE